MKPWHVVAAIAVLAVLVLAFWLVSIVRKSARDE